MGKTGRNAVSNSLRKNPILIPLAKDIQQKERNLQGSNLVMGKEESAEGNAKRNRAAIGDYNIEITKSS